MTFCSELFDMGYYFATSGHTRVIDPPLSDRPPLVFETKCLCCSERKLDIPQIGRERGQSHGNLIKSGVSLVGGVRFPEIWGSVSWKSDQIRGQSCGRVRFPEIWGSVSWKSDQIRGQSRGRVRFPEIWGSVLWGEFGAFCLISPCK